ncbi:MAG: biopolymer transporter ExbD [Planctomycetota bacterium]|nr:biopolymer transporter ExbD [Planctomycetota bacterium]
MSIRFDCVGCQKNIVVHDRFEGRNVRCPSCSFELIVPKKQQSDNSASDVRHNDDVDAEPDDVETFVDAEAVDSESESELSSIAESGESEVILALQPKAATKKRASRSIRSGHDEAEEDVEWDITPMVDVAFLLLIFFMLTASFSIQKVIRTTPPQSDQPSTNAVQTQLDDKTEKIRIQIDEFNAYTVVFADGQTNEASSKQELITILKDFRLQAGDQLPRIVIQAHVDSFHGATVGCMDAARAAEFTDFQLFAVENFD